LSPHYLDTEAVLAWLEHDVLPNYESLMHLASVLSERSGIQAGSWQRNLMRLRHRSRIEFFTLDRLCSLLGEHVSRFCDLNQFVESER